ncbi:hypothetical protein R1flu_009784 [Riccia fluitans]|uniref:VOC domain-containing protein n=1 Tax=Riccia fluitans TaxID=41844 RepID=A0ABD1Z7B2_9MARC
MCEPLHRYQLNRLLQTGATRKRNCVAVGGGEETCGTSKNFYENVLGFVQIKRPGSFDFDGAWLFNYGIGIHLLQKECGGVAVEKEIDPKADHVSFQCEDMYLVEEKLKESGIRYLRREVEENGIMVDQLFFHDPDGFMIEVCDCDKLPVVPLARAASITNQQQFFSSVCKRTGSINKNQSAVAPSICEM